ncbi:MAG TPA: DUF2716 domain-containing protein [Jatrophihabitans sp.]|jgi:hypothetical protein
MSQAWIELDPDEYDRSWAAFCEQFHFRPSTDPATWPAITEPVPSLTFDLGPVFDVGQAEFTRRVAAVNEAGFRSFAQCMGAGHRMIALDWQHPGYWYRPAEHAFDREAPVPVFPNGDYYVHLREDFSGGTFGHPWERTLCVFGADFVETLGASLATWLPLKRQQPSPELES